MKNLLLPREWKLKVDFGEADVTVPLNTKLHF